MGPLEAIVGLLLAAASKPAYVDAAVCGTCHPQIQATYRRTGMGRSFYRAAPENTPDNATYYHAASGRRFQITGKSGRYVMRRWEDADEANVVEKTIDYVLGSGNHARSYVSRGPDGRLIALPLVWYADGGGVWAMAPGYDRPDHADMRREISLDCMFCHNGYPEMAPGADRFEKPARFQGKIPEGIDCQRCHGPGGDHVEAARSGAAPERVRAAIVNPGRLTHERQLDVCLQCHLQSTSRRLPYSVRRFDRGMFSFRAGEPLAEYMLHFKLDEREGREPDFEVVHAGSRFLESACYKRSAGKLTCTTCHDAHGIRRGEAARTHYAQVCAGCHSAPKHESPVSSDCTVCHMPKRRTDDAVHVVMTDHLIARRPPAGDLLAAKQQLRQPDANEYLGRVVPLYPKHLTGSDELYLAMAQVRESANLKAGIPEFERALRDHKPRQPEFYREMAQAFSNVGRPKQAIAYYQQALERDAHSTSALRGLGQAYTAAGEMAAAITALDRATSLDPRDAEAWTALGAAYQRTGRLKNAQAALRRAIEVNPDLPEPHFNLGVVLAAGGETVEAEAAFRSAVRVRPDFSAAHTGLGGMLDRQRNPREAERHFARAVQLSPEDAAARYAYGLHLASGGRFAEAREHMAEGVRLDPSAAGYTNLGTLLAKLGDPAGALKQYGRALAADKTFEPARLNLARTLIGLGRRGEAVEHLEILMSSRAAEMRAAAAELLKIARSRE